MNKAIFWDSDGTLLYGNNPSDTSEPCRKQVVSPMKRMFEV